MIQEKAVSAQPGFLMLALLLGLMTAAVYALLRFAHAGSPVGIVAAVLVLVATAISFGGLTVVNPNEAQVVLLFGNYTGSLKQQGLWWVNPFSTRRKVSQRIRNFESAKLKVNDHDGNPIEIAAVVVWRVVETAEAIFHVDNYENFVKVQSEAAVRNLASTYPYDAHAEGEHALRSHTAEVAEKLKAEIQERLTKAGVEVMEARISHLAYAPEIASAMLRRQQAAAVIAARTRIVEGAVSMVQMALDELSSRAVVQLDEERKAAMVSNLLVVLCSDRDTQPIVNAGTLYT